jgi:hypothetical protein
MVQGIERRKHSRVDVPAKLVTNPGLRAINLSESGMLLASRNKILVDSRIQLTLDLRGKIVEIGAVVRRCAPSQSVYEEDNMVGVQFDPLGATLLLTLREYIDSVA